VSDYRGLPKKETGVIGVPEAFSVKLGKVPELS